MEITENLVIVQTLSSPVALQVVMTTTCVVANDDKVGIMTTSFSVDTTVLHKTTDT